MGHPDFRVSGKIFATLGYPKPGSATIMVSPLDQDLLMRSHPEAFARAAGAWGRSGSTTVTLRIAPRRAVALALESAWKMRAPKKFVSGHLASRVHGRGNRAEKYHPTRADANPGGATR